MRRWDGSHDAGCVVKDESDQRVLCVVFDIVSSCRLNARVEVADVYVCVAILH